MNNQIIHDENIVTNVVIDSSDCCIGRLNPFNICAVDLPRIKNVCDGCQNDILKMGTLTFSGKSGQQLCFECIHAKVTEPKLPQLTSVDQCMICLENEKDVFCWKRHGQDMRMCLDCVFDNTLFNKASTSFNTHQQKIDSDPERIKFVTKFLNT